ncbi:MAG: ABC transporter ATP-binding protein [Prochlorotrichaceae cyanobacterium]
MATIRFDQVTKQYPGGGVAVDRLCLEIQDQEFLVLVGPSGCGKTTSLRLLAGLERISAGDLYLDQQRINDLPAKDRNMAMVFQSYALYPHMTVFENMAFALTLQALPKANIQQRIAQVAQQLEIGHLLDRKPGQLSGGQRQRVAVGRAMVRNPTAFLMDEPLSNLDAQLRVQARTELSKLHQQLHATFIYVTHDQVEAMTLGTRIAILNQGILQQVDTPQQVYDFPANRFVASFLGSPAMNFWEAQIHPNGEAEQWEIVTPSLRLPLDRCRFNPDRFPANSSVLLGVRPESFYFPHSAPPHIQTLPVTLTVTLVEPLGYELIVYGTLADGQSVVARLDPRLHPHPINLPPGTTLPLELDLNHYHLFDLNSEDSLVRVAT